MLRHRAEFSLWTFGLLCSAALIATQVEAAEARKASLAIVDVSSGAPASVRAAHRRSTADIEAGSDKLLGRLEIPALHLSTPIVDDDDTQSLLRGAGHIRGTAMPGGLGNFVVAAHRDTYFRPLSGIRPGMKIRVVTPGETFTYIVDAFKIVNPEDVDVLNIGDVPQMTLITCYPFHYIGAAPQRFAVSAHLTSF